MEKYIKDLTVTEFLELIGKKPKEIKIKRVEWLDSFIKENLVEDIGGFIPTRELMLGIGKKCGHLPTGVYFGMRMRLCGFKSIQRHYNGKNCKGYQCLWK